MANGFLKRRAVDSDDVKTYLGEGMLFEAFITLIREAESTEEIDEIEFQAQREFEVQCRDMLTEEELESIQYEATDYRRKLRWE